MVRGRSHLGWRGSGEAIEVLLALGTTADFCRLLPGVCSARMFGWLFFRQRTALRVRRSKDVSWEAKFSAAVFWARLVLTCWSKMINPAKWM